MRQQIDELQRSCAVFGRMLNLSVSEVTLADDFLAFQAGAGPSHSANFGKSNPDDYSAVVARTTIIPHAVEFDGLTWGIYKSPYVFLTSDDEGRVQAWRTMLTSLMFASGVQDATQWEIASVRSPESDGV